jgi:hypothetical protein
MLALTSLLSAIAERYHKALQAIDADAAAQQRSGTKKQFHVGDADPGLQHLHTGTPDCPMRFVVELEPAEWRKFAKCAVRKEVYGGGANPRPLVGILNEMEERQKRWHDGLSGTPGKGLFGATCKVRQREREMGGKEEANCLLMIKQVRRMINALDFSHCE